MFHSQTRLFATISGPTYKETLNQIQQCAKKVDGIELRLDLFTFSFEKITPSLMPLPTIFTWKGGDEKKLLHLLELSPEFVDLDYKTPLSLLKKISALFPLTKIICSYHNFEKTPSNLHAVLEKLKNRFAHIYKVACFANTTCDALSMLKFAKESSCIGVSMGERGISSRILAPVVGIPLTYAACAEDTHAAPGQLTADELSSTYHFGSLNRQTEIYALIGNPICQSPSHYTHNAFFERLKRNAVYVKWLLTKEELPTFFALIKALPVLGLSVTIPYKEALFCFLAHLDNEAKKMGALNTLLHTKNGWSGFNTDGKGACDALEKRVALKGKTILLLGAGGSAKAIAFEATARGALLLIYNRTEQKARSLAAAVGQQSVTTLPDSYDILINTIPEKMPLEATAIKEKSVVMDLSPSLELSPLLKAALKKNCVIVKGYEMFLAQAEGQFKLWRITKNHALFV